MSFDDRSRAALDRASAAIRTHVEAGLAGFAEELTQAAADERAKAAAQAAEAAGAEVRRHAEGQIAQLREAAYKQAEEIKRAAEAHVGELRKALQAQLEEVRRAAQGQVEEVRRAARAEIEDARRLAASQVDDVQRHMQAQQEETRRDLEAQIEEARRRGRADVEAARADAEAARRAAQAEAEEVVIAQLAVAQAQAEQRVSSAVEQTRTDAHQADLAHAVRLVDAVRILDDARSLGEALDALTECAGREVERAAVLVVNSGRLRGWRMAGFPEAGPPKNLELDLDAAGLAGAVVRTGVAVSRQTVGPGDEQHTRQPALPPFAQDAGTRHAMALPILVGGEVVAVLYADAPRTDTPSGASRWPALLEILVRHASRALEAMTVERATGLGLPRPVARASHAVLPGPVEHGGTGDGDAARRYARLLVSEIRMFHEPLVEAGRRSRDLRTRLRGEIERARRLYEARVPPAVRDTSDYFEQELVRTLADGDRTLLG